MGGVEGGEGNQFWGLLGAGKGDEERKRWRRPWLHLAVHVPVRNDGRKKMAIGWAEKIRALVEEIGPKEEGKEK